MNHPRIDRRLRRAALAVALAVLALAACSPGDKKNDGADRSNQSSPGTTISTYQMMGDLPLVALDGTERRLSSYRGDLVVLYVFATWHKESISLIDEFNTLHDKIKGNRMTVLGIVIDRDGASAVKQLTARQPVTFPVFTNGAAIIRDLGGMRTLPTAYVLLRDGHIYHKAVGYRAASKVEDQLRRVVAQRL